MMLLCTSNLASSQPQLHMRLSFIVRTSFSPTGLMFTVFTLDPDDVHLLAVTDTVKLTCK